MKLLLDQGLPRSTVKHLAAADDVILDAGRQQHAIVVTLDADFHQLLALQRRQLG